MSNIRCIKSSFRNLDIFSEYYSSRKCGYCNKLCLNLLKYFLSSGTKLSIIKTERIDSEKTGRFFAEGTAISPSEIGPENEKEYNAVPETFTVTKRVISILEELEIPYQPALENT